MFWRIDEASHLGIKNDIKKYIGYVFKVKMYRLKIIFTSQAIDKKYLSLTNGIWFIHSEINVKSYWKFPLLNISGSKNLAVRN